MYVLYKLFLQFIYFSMYVFFKIAFPLFIIIKFKQQQYSLLLLLSSNIYVLQTIAFAQFIKAVGFSRLC